MHNLATYRKALEFYSKSPDSQYDNVACEALELVLTPRWFESRTITHDGNQFRLICSSKYGIGLQARPDVPLEEWVDVEVMQSPEELGSVIAELLCIGFDN